MQKKQKITQTDFVAAVTKRQSAHLKGKRIGIYAGAFNPVHAGHIAFALQAIQVAKLDQLVFVPERMPRSKPSVEHFAHRVAMLNRATTPYPNMAVLELVDKHFTVRRTWPQLQTTFPGATLALLMGSDVALRLPDWPQAEMLLGQSELVVGVRSIHQLQEIGREMSGWKVQPKQRYILESFAPHISSTDIRVALSSREQAKGLLASVHRYAGRNWLYVSIKETAAKIV
jgi:nicotinate-nucleotide adenylyltransferase